MLYIASMWIAGVMQGLMWGALNEDGTLTNPNFIVSVRESMRFYLIRLSGGLLYLSGMILMAYNVYRTAAAGKPVDAVIPALTQHQQH